jgi:hypothetical protein
MPIFTVVLILSTVLRVENQFLQYTSLSTVLRVENQFLQYTSNRILSPHQVTIL